MKITSYASLAGAIAFWLASAAGAQQPNPSPETGSVELSEIVVTATRRSESVQTVPLSITAVSAEDLANSGATQTRDLVELAPNLSEQGSFGRTDPSFFIRGVGSTQFNPNSNSKVGVYLDDVYLNSPAVQGSQLFDVDHIEIARGPGHFVWPEHHWWDDSRNYQQADHRRRIHRRHQRDGRKLQRVGFTSGHRLRYRRDERGAPGAH
jgi:outer membrane cobalamin receptor